jgi:tripartite-type tricarboxylate transporter receptor subunit TctC
MFFPIPAVIEYTRVGKLRALAVTTATRSEALPDVPTVAEFLPGFEASSWWGVGAPRGTPAEIIGKLNREINAGLADPSIKQRLAELGGAPVTMTAPEFGSFVSDDTQKWAKVIRAANIKPD